MNSQALGGGVMLAVGAALWALYFLPIWANRRKFAAAQQNALRIQRTLRMLAETAEMPEEVRVEATAREALAHERLLEAAGRSQLAEHEARLAEAKLAEQQAILEARANRKRADALKRELIRRSHGVRIARLVTASIAALALLAFVAGIVFAILGLGSTLLGLSVAALLLAVGALVVMAPKQSTLTLTQSESKSPHSAAGLPLSSGRDVQRSAVAPRQRLAGSARVTTHATREVAKAASGRVSQPNIQDVEHAKQLLELARQQAEQVQRAAQREAQQAASKSQAAAASQVAAESQAKSEPRVVQRVSQRAPQRPQTPAGAQSFGAPQRAPQHIPGVGVDSATLRSMGVLDETAAQLPNLDVALQRRRAAS